MSEAYSGGKDSGNDEREGALTSLGPIRSENVNKKEPGEVEERWRLRWSMKRNALPPCHVPRNVCSHKQRKDRK